MTNCLLKLRPQGFFGNILKIPYSRFLENYHPGGDFTIEGSNFLKDTE